MKHNSQKSYQYPVLRKNSDDYLNESFSTDINVEFDSVSINIAIKYNLSSEEIKREIFKRKASYVSIVSCKDTFYTKSIRSNDNSISLEIDSGDLRGNVEIQSFVITEIDLEIQSSNLNNDYSVFLDSNENQLTNRFTYKKGDMLALSDKYLFAIDREYFKPLQSCIDIESDPKLKGGNWNIITSENHLKIIVSEKMFEIWSNLRREEAGKSALINSLYFSAITFAIKSLQDDSDLKDSYKWAEIIMAKINNLGINFKEDDFQITTKLLNEPLLSLENISYEY